MVKEKLAHYERYFRNHDPNKKELHASGSSSEGKGEEHGENESSGSGEGYEGSSEGRSTSGDMPSRKKKGKGEPKASGKSGVKVNVEEANVDEDDVTEEGDEPIENYHSLVRKILTIKAPTQNTNET